MNFAPTHPSRLAASLTGQDQQLAHGIDQAGVGVESVPDLEKLAVIQNAVAAASRRRDRSMTMAGDAGMIRARTAQVKNFRR